MKKTQIIELQVETGQIVLVEVSTEFPEKGTRTTRVGRSEDLHSQAKHSFEKALDVIKPLSDTIAKKIKELALQPDETTLEFGLKLNFSGSIVVASASSEANFKISMKWKKDEA
jgi:hypothetical protein